jgi:hypothetical protein
LAGPGVVPGQVAGLRDKDPELVQCQSREETPLIDIEKELAVGHAVDGDERHIDQPKRVRRGVISDDVELKIRGVRVVALLHSQVLDTEEGIELIRRGGGHLPQQGAVGGPFGAGEAEVNDRGDVAGLQGLKTKARALADSGAGRHGRAPFATSGESIDGSQSAS